MLLAIDVGNSNTSVGLFDQEKNLRFLAYLDTDSHKTADQISIDLMNLFTLYHYSYTDAVSYTHLLGKQESAWDLAKACNTTIRDLLSANQLESEEAIPREKLLLIPRKRA